MCLGLFSCVQWRNRYVRKFLSSNIIDNLVSQLSKVSSPVSTLLLHSDKLTYELHVYSRRSQALWEASSPEKATDINAEGTYEKEMFYRGMQYSCSWFCISEHSSHTTHMYSQTHDTHAHLGHLGKPFISSSESKVSRYMSVIIVTFNFVHVYMQCH